MQAKGKLERAPISKTWLWSGFFSGPAAWLVHLQLVYLMAQWACLGLPFISLHVASAVLLVIAMGGLFVAWRNWRAVGLHMPADQGEPVFGRIQFMSALGVMTGALFSLLITAQWIAVIFLDPCPAAF